MSVSELDAGSIDTRPCKERKRRSTRLAFQEIRTLIDHDSPRIVQAWLTGVNPELGDRIPLRLLREAI
ncbi:MAG TPA: hypothetical protein VGS78_12775 [Candidatus Sulfotelmatobacter sp.]|nr:hypothetical protein [Candidatus Sulfotelmatobacter sp.]